MSGPALVSVVDDDESVRESLPDLLRSFGFSVEAFSSAEELLRSGSLARTSCLILDVAMPGMTGPALQAELARRRSTTPIIFITGYGDIPMTVRAMKAGAVDFLSKPFGEEELLNAIRDAIGRSEAALRDQAELAVLRERHASLGRREREVMELVVSGLLNKQIGAQLGLSEVTVKAHRGKVMRKMQAGSLAELVRMADRLHRYQGIDDTFV